MAKIPGYRQRFDEAYRVSSPELRELFDNPETREQAGELYTEWQKCEAQYERYRAGQESRKRDKKRRPVALGRDEDFLFALSVMGDLAAIVHLQEQGSSRQEAIETVSRQSRTFS